MEYTSEQIALIEEYAGYLLPISDIATLIGVPIGQLRFDIQLNDAVGQAYRSGKAATKLSLHKQEVELAKAGSPLAVQLAAGYLLDMSDEEEDL